MGVGQTVQDEHLNTFEGPEKGYEELLPIWPSYNAIG